MNSTNNNSPEALPKKDAVSESVDSLISKKHSEKAAEGMAVVQESAEGFQSDVADVMAGMEKPSEKVSERKGESGEKGDIKATTKGDDDDDDQAAQIQQSLRSVIISEEVMVKKIRTAVNREIKSEIKRSKKLQKNLVNGSAHEYNESIKRIRKLKEVLASLVEATVEFVKSTYGKYFTSKGKRKSASEIED